jgi:hypothetical protein
MRGSAPLLLFAAAFGLIVLVAGGWLGAGRDAMREPPAAEVARGRDELAAVEREQRDALAARYPLGYAVFAVLGDRLLRVDGPEPAGRRPGVDWSRTVLASSVPTAVILQPPEVTADDGRVLAAAPVRMPHVAGFQWAWLRAGGIEGWAEVLEGTSSRFVCVLGLRPEVGGRRG